MLQSCGVPKLIFVKHECMPPVRKVSIDFYRILKWWLLLNVRAWLSLLDDFAGVFQVYSGMFVFENNVFRF